MHLRWSGCSPCMGALLVLALVISAPIASNGLHDFMGSDLMEEMYTHCMQIRATRNVPWDTQVDIFEDYLYRLAGLNARPDTIGPFKRRFNSSNPALFADMNLPVPGFPAITIGPYIHRGGLRELAKALMEGWGCDANAKLALELFRHAAALGDPEAQSQMAVRYSLGLQHHKSWSKHGIVHFGEADDSEAILHHYMAAMGGDPLSSMALGYAHMHGVGVPKSCWSAVTYYLPVAEQVADLAASKEGPGLPGIERIRLNVHYMQGVKADRQREVVQYYQDSADKGNVDAQTAVGQVLNYGTHGVERDHEAALSYLQRAADAGDIQAMAHLGNMLANGLGGGEPDYLTAFKHFQTAASAGSPSAQYGLGYMYLVGQGVAQDYAQAYKMFVEAANQGHADAHFYLGVMHLRGLGGRRKNIQRAFASFNVAASGGHVQAMYNAALLHLGGKGTTKSCKPASTQLKSASERSPSASALQQGHELFFKGHYQAALWQYLQAAAAGMELGQSNAAWLLARGYVRAGGLVHNVTFGLHQRSAGQGNVASLLAMGDAYFYGQGVPQDWVKAAAIYYEAYQERSAEAMFNLGFMHEFGAGVPKDLLLARRFYDMAKHTNGDSALAVYCARAWLVMHKGWEALRPHLPKAYDGIWEHVWTLNPPHTSVLGSWTAVVGSLLPSQAVMQLELGVWQWLDALGITSLLSLIVDGKDLGETALMFLLMLMLYAVLKLRRRRAAMYQQGQPAGDAAMPEAPQAFGMANAAQAREGDGIGRGAADGGVLAGNGRPVGGDAREAGAGQPASGGASSEGGSWTSGIEGAQDAPPAQQEAGA